jgi:hypothetical protein
MYVKNHTLVIPNCCSHFIVKYLYLTGSNGLYSSNGLYCSTSSIFRQFTGSYPSRFSIYCISKFQQLKVNALAATRYATSLYIPKRCSSYHLVKILPGMFGEHCSPLLVVIVTNSAADPDPDPLVRGTFIINKCNILYTT